MQMIYSNLFIIPVTPLFTFLVLKRTKFLKLMTIFQTFFWKTVLIPTLFFPDVWKLSIITPIPKKGKKDIIENYRPLPLLCNFYDFSKAFNKLTHDILQLKLLNIDLLDHLGHLIYSYVALRFLNVKHHAYESHKV